MNVPNNDTLMTEEHGLTEVRHTPETCHMCRTRQQRRLMHRLLRHPRRSYACCALKRASDTGRTSRGRHNHARDDGALDHETGTNFWTNDPSATRAVKFRMQRMPFYLRNVDPPIRTLDEVGRPIGPGE